MTGRFTGCLITMHLGWVLQLLTPHVVRMPRFFGDGMVLQTRSKSGVRAFISGWADPYEFVTVHVSNAGAYSPSVYGPILSDQHGAWAVQIHPPKYTPLKTSHPVDISVNDSNSGPAVVAHNVSFGDVFLCIGSTQMAKPALGSSDPLPLPPPNLRLFHVGEGSEATPDRRDVPASSSKGWLLADNPSAAPTFSHASALCIQSAAAFSRLSPYGEHYVGVIVAAVNGSKLQDWVPAEAAMRHCPDAARSSGSSLGRLYNGMVAPFGMTSTRGAFWASDEPSGAGCIYTYLRVLLDCFFLFLIFPMCGDAFHARPDCDLRGMPISSYD